MSKFFIEQLARILVEQASKPILEYGHFVPIIKQIRLINPNSIVSFQLIPLSISGLDLPNLSKHSKLY